MKSYHSLSLCMGKIQHSRCRSGTSSLWRRSLRAFQRDFSFYTNDNPPPKTTMGSPVYTVYGEEFAFSVKAIPPEFRALPSGTIVLDASKKGRILFEWTPTRGQNAKKYDWDASTRFALTAEEAASFVERLDQGDSTVEFSRTLKGDQFQNSLGQPLEKIFVAQKGDAATSNHGIRLMVDYVDPANQHQLGQIPHPRGNNNNNNGFEPHEGLMGPFEINLMIGEYKILRSIIDYSIPKLIGWATMFDKSIEQSIEKSLQGGGNRYNHNNHNSNRGGYDRTSFPHDYQGGNNNNY